MYAGKKTRFLKKDTSIREFMNSTLEQISKSKDKINSEIVDSYIKENIDVLNTTQINILKGFHKKITDMFVVFKYLKNNAILYQVKTQTFYAVKALRDRFDTMIPDIPCVITTTILPFEDFIIYEGFMKSHNTLIGNNIASEINELYLQAKSNKTIVKNIL